MATTIAGKSVLVTGASRGIGRALVEEALQRGATRVARVIVLGHPRTGVGRRRWRVYAKLCALLLSSP